MSPADANIGGFAAAASRRMVSLVLRLTTIVMMGIGLRLPTTY